MAKDEVYSWRVEAETKQALEDEARRSGVSLAALLASIARDWLEARRQRAGDDDAEQNRLREALLDTVGVVAGGDAERSARASGRLKKRLAGARGR